MVDGTGTTTYTPDALNRLASVTFPGSRTVAYGYDALGNRTSITYPGGSDEVAYAYDEAHNLVSVTDWNDAETVYAYDDAGRLDTFTLPNGVVGTYAYDNADRLAGIEWVKDANTLAEVAYTPDAVGNRTQRVDGLGTHTYGYDDLYRLTSVTYPGPQTDTYTYDAVGNRLTKNSDDYTYDAADRLTAVEAISYGWDDNGNLTSRGSDSFAWDAADRLTSAAINSVAASYTYNGDGLRMSRIIDSVTQTYDWDVAAGIPVVLDDGENRYVYGLGLISMEDGSQVQTYFLRDGLGSTMALTDDQGDVVGTYEYDVFGAMRAHTGDETEFSFTGEQNDPNGLEYLRARYYDGETGRFLSRDPLSGNPLWSGF